jgi:deoxyribodipyrimidine photo-lyase
MKVFTPYHKAWLAETKEDPSLLDLVPAPKGNDNSAVREFSDLFESKIPGLPRSRQYSSNDEQ